MVSSSVKDEEFLHHEENIMKSFFMVSSSVRIKVPTSQSYYVNQKKSYMYLTWCIAQSQYSINISCCTYYMKNY